MRYTAGRLNEKIENRLLILTPIYPQAVKTLPHPGRSSGSLLRRRLPDSLSVAVSAACFYPANRDRSLQQRELHRFFTCFPFNPPAQSDGTEPESRANIRKNIEKLFLEGNHFSG